MMMPVVLPEPTGPAMSLTKAAERIMLATVGGATKLMLWLNLISGLLRIFLVRQASYESNNQLHQGFLWDGTSRFRFGLVHVA